MRWMKENKCREGNCGEVGHRDQDSVLVKTWKEQRSLCWKENPQRSVFLTILYGGYIWLIKKKVDCGGQHLDC